MLKRSHTLAISVTIQFAENGVVCKTYLSIVVTIGDISKFTFVPPTARDGGERERARRDREVEERKEMASRNERFSINVHGKLSVNILMLR